ncbi:MAG: glycerate kinase [Gemmatimonadetes bacterium]|nr:glycerate kinase [Gemmatimonadota bacterium]
MILVAPTAFKGSMGAGRAARSMAAGVRRAWPGREVVELPLSDGGPGLIEAVRAARGGRVRGLRVTGPLGLPVRARLLRGRGVVLIESADACGLHLVPQPARDPLAATTFGLGELLLAGGAAERIVLGLGGSATIDGGAGMAQALGWRLLDGGGRPIPRGGAGLLQLGRIFPPAAPLRLPRVTALADVRSPLLGPGGAARVFGPQKGADAEGVRVLERGLAVLKQRIQEDLGIDLTRTAGAGAAGGLGAGAIAFLGAELVEGSTWVLEAVGFEPVLDAAELVVTGEGSYDRQSALGKITGEVVARARRQGKPVLVVAGRIEAALPDGVSAADAGGEWLSPKGLEKLVAQAIARLPGAQRPG